MALWLNLKRNKHYAEVYYKGVKILEIKVNEQNRGNVAFLDLDAPSDIVFKLVKESTIEIDDDFGNKEIFNK